MEKLFKDYWEGKVPLVKSYWIGCILIPIALVIPILPALGGGRVSDGYAMFTVLWFFVMTAANIYLLIGGFRIVQLFMLLQKKKKQNSGWGIAAQILIVLGGIRTVLEFLKVLGS